MTRHESETTEIIKKEDEMEKGGLLKLSANLSLILKNKNGEIVDIREYKNLIVTAGKNEIIQQVMGATGGGAQPAKFNYVGIGTDATGEVAGNTALGAEIGTRVQDTSPDFPSTGRGDIISVFVPGNGTGSIAEAGLLNASVAGTLLARKTFTPIAKGAGDALQVTWQITIA